MSGVTLGKTLRLSFDGTSVELQHRLQVLCLLLARVAECDVCRDKGLREVVVGHCRHMIVGDMCQRAHPQLHLAEDAGEPPHVLILQIAAVTPTVDLHSELVPAFTHEIRNVELCRRHGVLAIPHAPAVHPDVESRVHAPEVKYQVLAKHVRRDIDIRDIRPHRVAVLVSRPILRRLGGHAGTVPHERVVDVDIDGHTVALQLPVAGHRNAVPTAHIVVLAIEVGGTLFWRLRPMEKPLAVEGHYLLTLFPFRGQLQRGMIRQLARAQHGRVFPVVNLLSLGGQG